VGKAAAALAVVATALLVTSAGSAATRDVGAPAGKLYTVAFASSSLPANVDQLVAAAGGKIVDRLTQLGAVSVVSSDPTFASKIAKATGVVGADPALRTSILPSGTASRKPSWQNNWAVSAQRRRDDGQKLGRDPQPMPDRLGSLQWDKMRMDVSSTGSYRVNRGRNDVVVAFTDTGVDVNHPDIQPNLDLADSRNFITAPTDPSDPSYTLAEDYVGVQDYNGHGTWVTSAVAAPINGIGISGVAPNVTTVSLKTQDATGSGLLSDWSDAVRYAANMGVDVVSSSIYTYAPTCVGIPQWVCDDNDTDYLVAQRAVDYARSKGTLVVAALGNENTDVSNTTAVHDLVRDFFGVDFPGPWVSVPGTLRGVVGVSSTGYYNEKAIYSNYGLGAVDVAAPGGDHTLQNPGDLGAGTLIGAWSSTGLVGLPNPLDPVESCYRGTCGLYVFDQGTSMATPNVAGIAALIISQYGSGGRDNGGKHNGWGGDGETGRNRPQAKLSPDRVEKILTGTAIQRPCPNPAMVTYPLSWPYDTATCQGSPSNNGFFGHGIVNALAALGGQPDRR